MDWVQGLRWDPAELPPWLQLRVLSQSRDLELHDRLQQLVASHPGPVRPILLKGLGEIIEPDGAEPELLAFSESEDAERSVLNAYARFRNAVDQLDDDLLSAFEEAIQYARDQEVEEAGAP